MPNNNLKKKIKFKMIQYLEIYSMNSLIKLIQYIFTFKGQIIGLDVYGKKVLIRKGSSDFNVALLTLGYEFSIVKNFLDKNFRGLILDAGGYIGTASIFLADYYNKSSVICVEPFIENYKLLSQNISNFSNIEAYNSALHSESNKVFKLYNRKTGPIGYTITNHQKLDVIQEVQSINLDCIMQNFTDYGLIKIDIEGSEYDLLINDSENLDKFNIILIELHERIIEGIEKVFLDFNIKFNRLYFKTDGEKYISLKKDYRFINVKPI